MARHKSKIDHYLSPQFQEYDLICFASGARDSIQNRDLHNLWSNVLLGRRDGYETGENLWKLPLHMITDTDFDIDAICQITGLRTNGTDLDRYLCSLHEDKDYPYIRALKNTLGYVLRYQIDV